MSDLKSRVDDKILEPSNYDLLSKLIKNAENKTEAISIAELGTTYKRTGFHFDKKLEKIGSSIKYFKKNNTLSFIQDPKAKTHKLIIGDNYDALLNLSISYKGKIDVIYIDPPYGKDDMGEFAQTNYDNAITRDNLLSMLYPRLVLARELLSEEGYIFCSIDSKNIAYVKCIFDEIFGENNSIEIYTWESNFKPDNSSILIRPNAEYIICFARNKTKLSHFKKYESKTSGWVSLSKSKEIIKTIRFPPNVVKTNLKDGVYKAGKSNEKDSWRLEQDVIVKNSMIVSELIVTGPSYWASNEKVIKEIKSKTEFQIKNKKFIPYIKKASSGLVVSTTILPNDKISDYQQSKSELEEILENKNVFQNPKPVTLISFLISCVDVREAIILDFFAGSGTTGQAVLELNKEDGGNRTFILCTNNEVPLSDKNDKREVSDNNDLRGLAWSVTSKRLKRVMTGCCYDGSTDFEWIKKNQPLGDNLDVYTIESVKNNEQTAEKSVFDVIDETLYGEQELTPKDKIKWVCENFSVTQKYLEDRT